MNLKNTMIIKLLLLSFLVQSVLCDNCVTYNFENDFETLFSRSRVCTTWGIQEDWTSGNYTSISVVPPHELSSSFMSPVLPNILSCTTSFAFEMSSGSEFEIHVYLESELVSDGVNVFVNQVIDDGNVLTLMLNPTLPDVQLGWNILKGTLDGTGTFEGYVAIMGQASEESVLLIDAFRYIPASLDSIEDNDECIIYRADIDENSSVEDNNSGDNGSNATGESEETDNGSNETDEHGETEGGSNQTEENGETEDGSNESDENGETEGGSNQTEENGETEDTSNESDEYEETEDGSDRTKESEENGSNEIEEESSNQTDNEDSESEIDEIIETNSTTTSTTTSTTSTTTSTTTTTTTSESELTELSSEESLEAITEDTDDYTFWNALTIAMTAIVSCILLSVTCFICYECGKRRAQDKIPLMFNDVEIATPTLVPRVTKVYPDPNILHCVTK